MNAPEPHANADPHRYRLRGRGLRLLIAIAAAVAAYFALLPLMESAFAPVVRADLLGEYASEFDGATERLTLLADGSYTREVLVHGEARPYNLTGRWEFEAELITLYSFALHGHYSPREAWREGKAHTRSLNLPVDRIWWRIRLGDGADYHPAVIYRKR